MTLDRYILTHHLGDESHIVRRALRLEIGVSCQSDVGGSFFIVNSEGGRKLAIQAQTEADLINREADSFPKDLFSTNR